MARDVLRLETLHTRYCVEVPRERAHALFTEPEPSLPMRLGQVQGVSDVNYNPTLGPFVYLTIHDEVDTPRKHEAICNVIAGCLKEVAAKAKERSR